MLPRYIYIEESIDQSESKLLRFIPTASGDYDLDDFLIVAHSFCAAIHLYTH